jgi:sec-independent protein translocase protein TatB
VRVLIRNQKKRRRLSSKINRKITSRAGAHHMFDIGFAELILVSIVGLLVLGPERLPGAIRTGSMWLGKIRRSFNSIRADIERELRADEIKQDLHNASVMESLKQAEQDLRSGLDAAQEIGDVSTAALEAPAPDSSKS